MATSPWHRSHEKKVHTDFSRKNPAAPLSLSTQLATCSKEKKRHLVLENLTQRKHCCTNRSRSLSLAKSSANPKYSPTYIITSQTMSTHYLRETGCGKRCGCTRFAINLAFANKGRFNRHKLWAVSVESLILKATFFGHEMGFFYWG